MRWSSITTLLTLTATALGAPTPSTTAELTISDELLFQGDGFYTATFDDAGVANVTFTPFAELTGKVPAPVTGNVDTVLDGPSSTICSKNHPENVDDLDAANVALANAAPNGYNDNAWGWVHRNKQTSYWCNYERNYLTHDLVIAMHTDVSNKCRGTSSYGYSQRRNQGGIRNLVVGRTFTGDSFCSKGFKGTKAQRDSTSSPTPTLSAIPWTIPSESRDQGEGLYEASFDDAGVVTVKFTPKSAPTQAPVSKNPVRKDIDTLSKRDTTCSGAFTPDESALDWANEQVAHGVDGKDWKANYAVWVNSAHDSSYYCSYTRNDGSYQEVIDMHKFISSRCGGGIGYGYDRRRTPQGTHDHSVGRTFRGDHFCWKDQHGRRQARAPAQLSIPSDLREQGEGFYVATFDEAGNTTVKFTPLAELTPTAEVLANALAPLTENLVIKSRDSLLKRQGFTHCETRQSGDIEKLDHANVQLAHNVNKVNYLYNHWAWVHIGTKTAYMCPYNPITPTYDQIIHANVVISKSCGGSQAYGYLRIDTNLDGVDLGIGRTFTGDHFCTSNFYGGK